MKNKPIHNKTPSKKCLNPQCPYEEDIYYQQYYKPNQEYTKQTVPEAKSKRLRKWMFLSFVIIFALVAIGMVSGIAFPISLMQ